MSESKYEWHVFKHKRWMEPEVFQSAENAADRLNVLWEEGWDQASVIPVFKVAKAEQADHSDPSSESVRSL